jgi:hypothetical protein
MTTSAALDGISFHARILHYNSGRVINTYGRMFKSYPDICKVLEVTCTEDVTDTLIKIKEKRNNAPILIHVLRYLRYSSSSDYGPIILEVGHGCSPSESEFKHPWHAFFL